MIFETWVALLVYALAPASASFLATNTSVLRLGRLARLCRVARLSKLLLKMPEVLVLFKGLAVASRAVISTMFLISLIIYVFAILFKNLANGTALEEKYFENIRSAMGWLLLSSVCPDLVDTIQDDFSAQAFYLGVIYFFFVVLISFTVLNLLVGVLVNVVGVVANVEKEALQLEGVRNQLYHILETVDSNSDMRIQKEEFKALLLHQDVVTSLRKAGVDCIALVDLADTIFTEGKPDYEVHELVDVVLTLRGGNHATVKDCVDVRRLLKVEFSKLENMIDKVTQIATSQSLKDADDENQTL